ncbi:tetratricopeptide repeat protein [Acidobacteria bacterium AH-259-O06]|nr:tetratricopeptide repeat protein [Acidobacteria bacterium AH-259-O06]
MEKQANKKSRSTELLERLIAVEPNNPNALYLLGQNLFRVGKTEVAMKHWKRAVEFNPDHLQALYNLSRNLPESDPERSRYVDRYLATQKRRQLTDRVQVLNNMAVEAANARDWSHASAQLQEALELCGECSQRATLHRNLGLIYCRQGDVENGERELRLALKLNPNDGEALKALEILQAQVTKQAK